jgi:hypothetical protein
MLGLDLGGNPVSAAAFPSAGWDMYAAATIGAAQKHPNYRWEAALWFGRIQNGGDLRWYEVSYMDNPARKTRREWAPFALNDDDQIPFADKAAGPAMGRYQIAFGPAAIDGEGYAAFCVRWIALFSRACENGLCYPRQLPLPPTGY